MRTKTPWPFSLSKPVTSIVVWVQSVDARRHLQDCNNKQRFLPYTYPTMALDAPLTIERIEGKTPGTLIYRLIGPLTLRNLFDLQSQLRSADPPPVTIIDLTEVPYMDSTGMGMIVNHHVRCKSKGTKLIVSGVNSRVFELFKLTKVDTVIPMTSTVEEAEAGA